MRRKLMISALVAALLIISVGNASVSPTAAQLTSTALSHLSGGFGCGTLAGATVAATVLAALGGITLIAAAIGGIGFAIFC